MWEVFNDAKKPFDGILGKAVVKEVYAGRKPGPVPKFVPKEVSKLMDECSSSEADDRPSFKKILVRIKEECEKISARE